MIDKESYQNILVYNILYKSLFDSKPLLIRFDKINGFIRVYDGKRYLVLFGSGKYDSILNRIRYLTGVKSGITYIIPHNCPKVKVYSCDSLPLEKALTFLDAMILIKWAFNKDKDNYYYNIFLEKASYKLPKK